MADRVAYRGPPVETVEVGPGLEVASFVRDETSVDAATVRSFAEEWKKFDRFDASDLEEAGREYFDLLDPETLGGAVILDVGCGSGRWTRRLAKDAAWVEAVDPSPSVFHAAWVHRDQPNVRWTRASVETLPFPDETFDLVVCLGVLHHLLDPEDALRGVVRKVKPGGRLLLYVYYALENRGRLYRAIFRVSDVARRGICQLPGPLKRGVCDAVAIAVCMPLVLTARLLKRALPGSDAYRRLPLSYYHNKSFRVVRNDTLDRFGTPVEKRFTQNQIEAMMQGAGLREITFSDHPPYWHATGKKE